MKGLFIGLTGVDLIFYQENLPKENKKSKTNNYNMSIGGPAANAAITYKLLGGEASLVTCIGNSYLSILIKNELKKIYNIEVIDCIDNQNILPSISGISVNINNASRTIWSGQQLIDKVSSSNLTKIIKDKIFCLSDCSLPEISLDIINEVKKFKIPVILDAGSWKDRMEKFIFEANDIIASNDCKKLNSNKDLFELLNEYNTKNIAITNGEQLIKWRNNEGKEGYIKPKNVNAIDTLGAGDIFHGAYCYFKYLKEQSFEKSIENAAFVASNSVKYFGPRKGIYEYNNLNT